MMIGCFFSCLGPSKDRNSRKTANISPPSDRIDELVHTSHYSAIRNQDYPPNNFRVIQESEERIGEQFSYRGGKKVECEPRGKTFGEINSQKLPSLEEVIGSKTPKDSLQQNYRYQNCAGSGEGFEDVNHGGNEPHRKSSAMEENSESLFSISMEFKSKVCVSGLDDNEVNSPMPNQHLLDLKLVASGLDENAREVILATPALSSVENLTQLRAPKCVINPPLEDRAKQNINSDKDLGVITPLHLENIPSQQYPETSLKASNVSNRENILNMSLSSWLVDSDLHKQRQISPLSFQDRPILGALTVKELKEVSATSSPRRSPRKSPRGIPDDIPIIGSVGTYWSCTEQINMKPE